MSFFFKLDNKNIVLSSIELKSSPERKARTRTLIQIGGLLDKSGLCEFFNIELGDDLEQDIPSLDKAATLLGFLTEVFENIDSENEKNKSIWMNKGIRMMKERR